MRIGFNPNKDKVLLKSDFFHQVIVPVYIPHQEDYFKDSFQILKYCLTSLFKTSHSKTYFTIVNNGSTKIVVDYLNNLFDEGKIQEVIHTSSIGKLNAVLKGITGQQFQLITITDADVLFLNNWQNATYEVFEGFPKTGVVCPIPNSKMLRYYTSNILWDNLFSNKIKFTHVQDRNSMKKFAESIGNTDLYKMVHLDKNLTISNKSLKALVGAGHVVATYNSICFNSLKELYSKYSLGGNSEQLLLDKPAVDYGYWRLSTEKNYAFHMGNVMETWMKDKLMKIEIEDNPSAEINLKCKSKNGFICWLKISIFSRIIFRKPIWRLYLRYKGLTANEAKIY
tara:strand:+ start:2082 stop:3098 length:1017 start_codon:yes stop_codon:yes gene_type:complete